MRRMKDECDQALAKQWKIANEQLSLVRKSSDYLIIDFCRLFRQLNKRKSDYVLRLNWHITKKKNDLLKN